VQHKEYVEFIPLSNHVIKNAKLYADRMSYLKDQNPIDSYLEIGALAGLYTDMVIDTLSPKDITIVDHFMEDDWDQINNRRFTKESHYSFVKDKYKDNKNIEIIKKFIRTEDAELISNGKTYDYIYIDANHDLDFVNYCLDFAVSHLNRGGVIGFNDYMVYDHFTKEYYGVVSAVNKFLSQNPNWTVSAYVVGPVMHSDIYIKML
jgi:hypothetical protein